jgi:endoglucanase
MIYLSREGIPSGVLSVASRYIHSPIEVASLKDIKNAVTLLVEAIKAVPSNTEFASEPSVVLR